MMRTRDGRMIFINKRREEGRRGDGEKGEREKEKPRRERKNGLENLGRDKEAEKHDREGR